MDQADILRKIPGVDKLLFHPAIISLVNKYRYNLVLKTIRNVLDAERKAILAEDKGDCPSLDCLAQKIFDRLKSYEDAGLKPVINATGIVLHTNLGRAPLGENVKEDLKNVIGNYSNLEFNLENGKRGKRKNLFGSLIKELLNVEDVAVVNNNAAAVYLTLRALAENSEVIISRGELIEIGDSFRIPDIMKLSGAKMIEVGSSNKTKLSDYEKAITPETSILFKTHRSNFSLKGFTEETTIAQLSALAKKSNLVTICDIGSGLLFKHEDTVLQNELSVEEVIASGADLVMFSGDKLLGGPQCGVIAGKKALISKIEQHPLMRTYRVDKLTIAVLNAVLKGYLYREPTQSQNPVYFQLTRYDIGALYKNAQRLLENIDPKVFNAEVVKSKVQCGGGTLPGIEFDSYAVEICDSQFPVEELNLKLIKLKTPIVGFIRQSRLVIDLFCINDRDLSYISQSLNNLCQNK